MIQSLNEWLIVCRCMYLVFASLALCTCRPFTLVRGIRAWILNFPTVRRQLFRGMSEFFLDHCASVKARHGSRKIRSPSHFRCLWKWPNPPPPPPIAFLANIGRTEKGLGVCHYDCISGSNNSNRSVISCTLGPRRSHQAEYENSLLYLC